MPGTPFAGFAARGRGLPLLLLVALSAAPWPSEAQIISGTYVGDNNPTRAIAINNPTTIASFQPDVVIIKGDAAQEAVCRTSTMTGDNSKPLGASSALVANRIKSLNANGFTVGNDAQVNATGINYYWVAFKAQPGFISVGSYPGDGSDGRSIPGVGFSPEWVVVMSAGSSAAVHRSASMGLDSTAYFSATANGANLIQAFEATGFQVGNDPAVNGAGTYHYIAVNAVGLMMTQGSYAGNSTDPTSVAAGFPPEYVIVKAQTAEDGVARPASLAGDSTVFFNPTANAPDRIQALQTTGFEVGLDADVNLSGTTYYWVAFGRVPVTYHRSIGTAANRSSPADGTVEPTPNSNVVLGTGTQWVTWNRGRGDVITIGGTPYTVLGVDSDTQLRLTIPFTGAGGPGQSYTITRAFWNASAETAFSNWETCIDGPASACGSASLVADNRREVGIMYEDSVFVLTAVRRISGSTTDALHSITLTADGVNRHNGTPGSGVIVDGNLDPNGYFLETRDSHVTIEWLEIRRKRCAVTGCDNTGSLSAYGNAATSQFATNILFQNLLIHDFYEPTVLPGPDPINLTGIRVSGDPVGKSVTVRNSMIWNGDADGIRGDAPTDTLVIENCSVDGMQDTGSRGINTDDTLSVTVRNTIATTSTTDFSVGAGSFTGSNNTSTDGSAATYFTAPQTGVSAASIFVAPNSNLHLKADPNVAVNTGLDLSSSFWNDIDGQSRLGLTWDRGADERDATTAVELLTFAARGADGEVVLEWETGSEQDNLGFLLYRARSEEGPYVKITASVIPGLGSSPEGARYSYRDSGVTNGVTYYYKLEDIETTGGTEVHGPIAALPSAGASLPAPALEQRTGPALITFGDPSANSFRIIERGPGQVLLELVTSGFYGEPQQDGTVRLSIPGFEPASRAGSPSVPVQRPWVDALPGLGVEIISVRAESLEAIGGLNPSGAQVPEIVASRRGTVRAALRTRRARNPGPRAGPMYPEQIVRLLGVGFQGDAKKAQVELAPLRWDGASQELLLARRLLVGLAFRGREPEEIAGRSHRGRRYPAGLRHETKGVLVRFATTERGLYEVKFEDLPGNRRPVQASALRLSRQGKSVAFHLEPDPARFAPGSRMYFFSDGARANPYGREALYELELAGGGTSMPVSPAVPLGEAALSYRREMEREENRLYQAGLVDAPDLWLWDVLFAPATKSYPFEVANLAHPADGSRLSVWLQGASDFDADPDHHLRAYVNGSLVGELRWEGKEPGEIVAELLPGILRDGGNVLELESVSDTGAPYSMVFLDRFSVEYPRRLLGDAGRLEGTWTESGTATVSGVGSAAHVLDVTEEPPRWLSDSVSPAAGAVSFRAEAGRRYLVASQGAVFRPEVRRASSSGLKRERSGAEYLVIGPREFLTEAGLLLDLRRRQGLRAKAVAAEDVYEEFGFGEMSPEAIHRFLAYAYHRWPAPSVRYVLLLGDASYDYKDYLGTGVANRVPALPVRTPFLWTASDPTLAAVNGDDLLPDLAVGRLPAGSRSELRTMIEKVVGYETGEASLSRALVLVADNADQAGDFVTNAEEVAGGVLAGSDVRKLYLHELGAAAMRRGILDAFDEGASLMSYVGHGGIHLWAQENIFNTSDLASLSTQSQQPLLVTMNCLNGYFHFPYFNSLAEEALKAEGRGAIAAFSPSGLSVNEPAHLFHRALLSEVLNGDHERLGDAVLAAQEAYAASGAFPELLSIYHLLGDPALSIR